MKRVSRVLLFLLLFAKTEGSEKETFILDLLEKETFCNLVDKEGHFKVEFLPKTASTLHDYSEFKESISPYLSVEDKLNLAELYDDFSEIKTGKLIKQAEKSPEHFSEEFLRRIKLFSDYEKGYLVQVESEMPLFDVSLEEVLSLDALAESILKEKDSLDKAIEEKSKHWKIDRMPKTDLALLRMGVYELREMEANLANLVDDYVEIAKAYSGEESYKFINAILDTYYKEALECK